MKDSPLKSVGYWLHRFFASAKPLARGYLRFLGCLLKPLPDGSWKQRILNSIHSVRWPTLELPATRITVGGGFTLKLIPHIGEFDFGAHFLKTLRYEEEVLQWLKKRRYETVIEIGANIGIYTLVFSQIVGADGEVYSFEPSREAYRRLLQNLAVNATRNVHTFQCAVTTSIGFAKFYEPEDHLTNGSLSLEFASTFSPQVRSSMVMTLNGANLQQLIPMGRRVLLKIDVEGAESRVLCSLQKLIESYKPDIVIEVLETSVEELNSLRFLKLSGYELYNLTLDGPVKQQSFVATRFRDYCLLPGGLATETALSAQTVLARSLSVG